MKKLSLFLFSSLFGLLLAGCEPPQYYTTSICPESARIEDPSLDKLYTLTTAGKSEFTIDKVTVKFQKAGKGLYKMVADHPDAPPFPDLALCLIHGKLVLESKSPDGSSYSSAYLMKAEKAIIFLMAQFNQPTLDQDKVSYTIQGSSNSKNILVDNSKFSDPSKVLDYLEPLSTNVFSNTVIFFEK